MDRVLSLAGLATMLLLSSSVAQSGVKERGRGPARGAEDAAHTKARRLLEETTFGPTEELVNHVARVGFDRFLDEQFAAPMSSYPTLPPQLSIPPPSCTETCLRDGYTTYPLQRRFFTNALYGEDQLRQRVSWALHKIFAISGAIINEPKALTPYLQVLDRHAFGNFRDLLRDITLNPAMGAYLNMVTSTKAKPNENYAREILQLFSLGTVLLNPDGTARLDAKGEPRPTYDQSVVDGFTKVLTGWTFAPHSELEHRNDAVPMIPGPDTHDTGRKLLLDGVVLPAGQTIEKDLDDALGNIFNHPNVGPFISKQLIQSLVTSNPSPAYVGRVAAVFDRSPGGVRGDLKEVVRAIILDPEARNDAPPAKHGHMKEPVLLVTNVLRAFGVRSADGGAASDGYLNPLTAAVGQDVFRPPTVFSYYPPDYLAPGTGGLLGPELALMSAAAAVGRANLVNKIVFEGMPVSVDAPAGTSLDLSGLQPMAGNPRRLASELDRRLLHGTMSAGMRDSIARAVEAVPSLDRLGRARQAVYLVCTSSQYQVQR
jgi:uncharacterized protein (DUF1800 family)